MTPVAPNANNTTPIRFPNAAMVGFNLAATTVVSVVAQEAIATLTGVTVPFESLAIIAGTSLFFGSRSLMERVQADPGSVYVGEILAMTTAHVIASEGHPVAGLATGALLGAWAAERLSHVTPASLYNSLNQ